MKRFAWLFFLMWVAAPGLAFSEERPSVAYDFQMTKGTALLSSRHYEAASAAFRNALLARPNDGRATYLLGLSEVKEGYHAQAENTLQSALTLYTQKDDVYLAIGELYLKQERYAEAAETLKKVSGKENPLISYYQGLAYEGLHDDDQAIPLLSQALREADLQHFDWAEAARYHLGLSQYRKKQYPDAQQSFTGVLKASPKSHRGKKSEMFLQRIEDGVELSSTGERVGAWGVVASAGLQYDSNVVLEPTLAGVIGPVERKKDYRFLFQVDADYKPHSTSVWGAGYTFHQTLHSQSLLKDFNVQSHEPKIFLVYDKERFQSRLDYLFNYTEVGEAPYVKSHTLRPLLTIVHRPALSTQLFYRFDYHDYKAISFFINNKERSGVNHALGATEHFYFNQGKQSARVGYVYDQESADGNDWDGNGHQILVGMQAQIDGGWMAEATGDYTHRDYTHSNSFARSKEGPKRNDQVYSLGGGISHDFSKAMEIGLQYVYLRNNSNLAVFDYNRSVYSVLLSGRF